MKWVKVKETVHHPYNPRCVAVQVEDTGGLSEVHEAMNWKAEEAFPLSTYSWEDLPIEDQQDLKKGRASSIYCTDNGNYLMTGGMIFQKPTEDKPEDADFYIHI